MNKYGWEVYRNLKNEETMADGRKAALELAKMSAPAPTKNNPIEESLLQKSDNHSKENSVLFVIDKSIKNKEIIADKKKIDTEIAKISTLVPKNSNDKFLVEKSDNVSKGSSTFSIKDDSSSQINNGKSKTKNEVHSTNGNIHDRKSGDSTIDYTIDIEINEHDQENEHDGISTVASTSKEYTILNKDYISYKEQTHANLRIFKEKILSTSELIAEFHLKSQELDKTKEKLREVTAKLERCYGETGALRIKLEKALQANEPLKKTHHIFEHEKVMLHAEIEELKTELKSSNSQIAMLRESAVTLRVTQEGLRKQNNDNSKETDKEKKKVLNQAKLIDKLNEKLKDSKVTSKTQGKDLKALTKENQKLKEKLEKMNIKSTKAKQKGKKPGSPIIHSPPSPPISSESSHPASPLSRPSSPLPRRKKRAVKNKASPRLQENVEGNKWLQELNDLSLSSSDDDDDNQDGSHSCGNSDGGDDDEVMKLNQLRDDLTHVLKGKTTSPYRFGLPGNLSPPLSPIPPSPIPTRRLRNTKPSTMLSEESLNDSDVEGVGVMKHGLLPTKLEATKLDDVGTELDCEITELGDGDIELDAGDTELDDKVTELSGVGTELNGVGEELNGVGSNTPHQDVSIDVDCNSMETECLENNEFSIISKLLEDICKTVSGVDDDTDDVIIQPWSSVRPIDTSSSDNIIDSKNVETDNSTHTLLGSTLSTTDPTFTTRNFITATPTMNNTPDSNKATKTIDSSDIASTVMMKSISTPACKILTFINTATSSLSSIGTDLNSSKTISNSSLSSSSNEIAATSIKPTLTISDEPITSSSNSTRSNEIAAMSTKPTLTISDEPATITNNSTPSTSTKNTTNCTRTTLNVQNVSSIINNATNRPATSNTTSAHDESSLDRDSQPVVCSSVKQILVIVDKVRLNDIRTTKSSESNDGSKTIINPSATVNSSTTKPANRKRSVSENESKPTRRSERHRDKRRASSEDENGRKDQLSSKISVKWYHDTIRDSNETDQSSKNEAETDIKTINNPSISAGEQTTELHHEIVELVQPEASLNLPTSPRGNLKRKVDQTEPIEDSAKCSTSNCRVGNKSLRTQKKFCRSVSSDANLEPTAEISPVGVFSTGQPNEISDVSLDEVDNEVASLELTKPESKGNNDNVAIKTSSGQPDHVRTVTFSNLPTTDDSNMENSSAVLSTSDQLMGVTHNIRNTLHDQQPTSPSQPAAIQSMSRRGAVVARRHSMFVQNEVVPAPRLDRSKSYSPQWFIPPSPPLSPIPPSPRRNVITPMISPLPTTPLPDSLSPLPPSPKITSPPLIRGSALVHSENKSIRMPIPLTQMRTTAVQAISFNKQHTASEVNIGERNGIGNKGSFGKPPKSRDYGDIDRDSVSLNQSTSRNDFRPSTGSTNTVSTKPNSTLNETSNIKKTNNKIGSTNTTNNKTSKSNNNNTAKKNVGNNTNNKISSISNKINNTSNNTTNNINSTNTCSYNNNTSKNTNKYTSDNKVKAGNNINAEKPSETCTTSDNDANNKLTDKVSAIYDSTDEDDQLCIALSSSDEKTTEKAIKYSKSTRSEKELQPCNRVSKCLSTAGQSPTLLGVISQSPSTPVGITQLPNTPKQVSLKLSGRSVYQTEEDYAINTFVKLLSYETEVANVIIAFKNVRNISKSIPIARAFVSMAKKCQEVLLPKLWQQIQPLDSTSHQVAHNTKNTNFDSFHVCHPTLTGIKTPILTKSERLIMVVLKGIKDHSNFRDCFPLILQELRNTIWNCRGLLSCEVLSLCRLYAGTCRVFNDMDALVMFLYETAFDEPGHTIKFSAIFLTCYTVWPTIVFRQDLLQYKNTSSFYKAKMSPLSTCFILLAFYHATRDEAFSVNTKMLQHLFSVEWKDEFDGQDESTVLKCLVNELYMLLKNKELSFDGNGNKPTPFAFTCMKAVQLLCLRVGWEWTYNELIACQLWSDLKMLLLSNDEECDIGAVVILVQLIENLIQCGIRSGFRNFEDLANFLIQLMNDTQGLDHSIRLSSAHVVLRIAPILPSLCTPALRTWKTNMRMEGITLPKVFDVEFPT